MLHEVWPVIDQPDAQKKLINTTKHFVSAAPTLHYGT